MAHSDAQITMYMITTLRRAAARKAAQHRRCQGREILLFDAPVKGKDSDDERAWGDFVKAQGESVEEKVTRNTVIKQLLRSLTPREREVVIEIFVQEQNETQAAQRLGIRQQRVSQLKKQALMRMRAELERQDSIA